jgi:hypothetical protein
MKTKILSFRFTLVLLAAIFTYSCGQQSSETAGIEISKASSEEGIIMLTLDQFNEYGLGQYGQQSIF